MKLPLYPVVLLLVPLAASGYKKDPDHGLLFNETKVELAVRNDAPYHDLESALLVSPNDLPERGHYSNSSMARVELHVIQPDGGARRHRAEGFREQVFIILEGEMEFTVDGDVLAARKHDVVFVPASAERAFVAKSPAKVLQADWWQAGEPPADAGRAFVVSEKGRVMRPTHGEGYITVTPNPRQQGQALSITGYGGHVNATNALLLYPLDLQGARPFTANTRLSRMGLSAYRADGGTPWHFHPDREQCFVILAGKALLEVGANTVEVKPGDIVFAPRHVGHGYKSIGSDAYTFMELEWGRN